MKNDSASLYRRYGPIGPQIPPMPVFAARAEGAWIEDAEGKRYLDLANGGSLPLGYTSEGLGAKTGDSPSEKNRGQPLGVAQGPAKGQSPVFGTVPVFAAAPGAEGVVWRPQVELAHKLAELVPGGMNRRVLVCDSGREALARAVELARNATNRTRVSYLFDLSDKSDLRAAVTRDVAAVVAHPLDGRVQQVRQVCDTAGALLIDDETGVGPGACGKMFASELSGFRPDVYVLGRGWAAGRPFGACVTGSSNLRWERGSSGNPAGCAGALEVIRLLEGGLLSRGKELAAYMQGRFEKLDSKRLAPVLWGVGLVKTLVLGTAPMRGQSPSGPARGLVERCRELGLLLGVVSGDAVAVRPPLVAGESDIDFAAEVVGKVLAEFDKAK